MPRHLLPPLLLPLLVAFLAAGCTGNDGTYPVKLRGEPAATPTSTSRVEPRLLIHNPGPHTHEVLSGGRLIATVGPWSIARVPLRPGRHQFMVRNATVANASVEFIAQGGQLHIWNLTGIGSYAIVARNATGTIDTLATIEPDAVGYAEAGARLGLLDPLPNPTGAPSPGKLVCVPPARGRSPATVAHWLSLATSTERAAWSPVDLAAWLPAMVRAFPDGKDAWHVRAFRMLATDGPEVAAAVVRLVESQGAAARPLLPRIRQRLSNATNTDMMVRWARLFVAVADRREITDEWRRTADLGDARDALRSALAVAQADGAVGFLVRGIGSRDRELDAFVRDVLMTTERQQDERVFRGCHRMFTRWLGPRGSASEARINEWMRAALPVCGRYEQRYQMIVMTTALRSGDHVLARDGAFGLVAAGSRGLDELRWNFDELSTDLLELVLPRVWRIRPATGAVRDLLLRSLRRDLRLPREIRDGTVTRLCEPDLLADDNEVMAAVDGHINGVPDSPRRARLIAARDDGHRRAAHQLLPVAAHRRLAELALIVSSIDIARTCLADLRSLTSDDEWAESVQALARGLRGGRPANQRLVLDLLINLARTPASRAALPDGRVSDLAVSLLQSPDTTTREFAFRALLTREPWVNRAAVTLALPAAVAREPDPELKARMGNWFTRSESGHALRTDLGDETNSYLRSLRSDDPEVIWLGLLGIAGRADRSEFLDVLAENLPRYPASLQRAALDLVARFETLPGALIRQAVQSDSDSLRAAAFGALVQRAEARRDERALAMCREAVEAEPDATQRARFRDRLAIAERLQQPVNAPDIDDPTTAPADEGGPDRSGGGD